MRARWAARIGSIVVCYMLMLLLAACSGTTTAMVVPTSTATATPTATLRPTATRPPTPSLSFSGDPCTATTSNAEVATTLSARAIPLPNATTVVEKGFAAADDFVHTPTYELIGACTKTSTTDAVRTFYAAQMPVMGWTQSAIFPYQGNFSAACGDPYCWTKPAGNGITIEVSLEHVQATDNGTSFNLNTVSYH